MHRRDEFRGERINQQRVRAEKKIKLYLKRVVTEVLGEDGVTAVRLRQVESGEEEDYESSALFIAIGHVPGSGYLKGVLKLDEDGYLLADRGMATSLPGVFVAGDVRHGAARQLVTAMSDGAVAAIEAEKWLKGRGG